MDPLTTPFERALHLLLFVSGGVTVAAVALTALERLSESTRRTVRPIHVVAAALLFGAFFAAERIYHGVH